MSIEKGNVVILKSGGPLMTVMSVDPGSDDEAVIACSWFSSTIDGKSNESDMHRGKFCKESIVVMQK